MLNKIIDELIEKKIDEINNFGSVIGGHNGPYYDDETPVRNTSHVAFILSYYYNKTRDSRYYDALLKCEEYLLSKDARPFDLTYYCRIGEKKDKSNGIIGQAWAIEGLISLYKTTHNFKLLELAQMIFLMIPFSEKYSIWEIIDIDGSNKGFDMTFNHQLWFVASGIQILSCENNSEIKKRCESFLNNIENLINTYPNGLISHLIKVNDVCSVHSKPILAIRNLAKRIKNWKRLYYKENGYHLFNMYAFAIIRNYGFNSSYFKTKKFEKNLDYCYSSKINYWLQKKSLKDLKNMKKVKNVKMNIYGYGYNAPGFELPYINLSFKDIKDVKNYIVEDVISKQVMFTYDKDRKG
ncbi:MAG: hypothetical protein ACOCRK_12015, partial [bacterium]